MKVSAHLKVKVLALQFENLKVTDSNACYLKMENRAKTYRDQFQETPIGSIPGVQNTRKIFRAIGIEPTKHRPSSEALLNRAIKGKPLFSINSFVDLGNWCSLEFLLPVCVYDNNKITGEIILRKGISSDRYRGINNREVKLENRYAFADDIGAFGSPMTDSQRTAISVQTTNAMWFTFFPIDATEKEIDTIKTKIIDRVFTICNGVCTTVEILQS